MKRKHFNLTIIGDNEKYDIHHYLVDALTPEDALQVALQWVSAKFNYRRMRLGSSIIEVVPYLKPDLIA